MKITEKARVPGMCFICAQLINVGDVIVCSHLGVNPVAAHAQCDPEFATGGSAAPEKVVLRSERGVRATPDQQLWFLIRDVLPVLVAVASGYDYDPGSSDLDDEQTIHVRMTLGDYRRASRLKSEMGRV
jgi:hypothetical protein